MYNKEEQIRQLYADGVLSKEEMEAELAKIGLANPAKRKGIYWMLAAGLCICTIVAFFLLKPKTSEPETVSSMLVEEEVTVQTAKWERTTIDGILSLQTRFDNPQFGVLEVSYNPSMGFRFAWFNNGTQKELNPTGGISYPVICTQEMVDKGQPKEALGEELMMILQKTNRTEKFLFYNNPKDVQAFIEHLNDGSVSWLQLSQFVENGNEPSDSDFGGEYVNYCWGTRFIPGEFSEAMKSLR